MRKRIALIIAFGLLSNYIRIYPAFCDAGSAAAADHTSIVMKFGTSSAESSIVAQAFVDWSKRLAESSGGKVKVDVFFSSVLGNSTEMMQGAQMGIIDIVVIQPGGIADMGAKKMSLYCLPYLFENYDQYLATLFGNIGEELLRDVTENVPGLVGFSYLPDSGRSYFSKKPIRNINDIRGMKMRLQPYAIDTETAAALGASSTPISFSELYSALQTGVVDGAENSLTSIDGAAMYEVTKYLTLDDHTYNLPILVISRKTWDRLSEDTKNLMRATWRETLDQYFIPLLEKHNAALLVKFAENGVEIIRTLEDREKWVEAVQPVWVKYGAGIEDLIDGVKALGPRGGGRK